MFHAVMRASKLPRASTGHKNTTRQPYNYVFLLLMALMINSIPPPVLFRCVPQSQRSLLPLEPHHSPNEQHRMQTYA